MLDGGVEKAHKAVRANELATSERATGKEIFPDGKKKFLTRVWKWDISLPRVNELPRRGREKKLSRKWKKLVDSESEAA